MCSVMAVRVAMPSADYCLYILQKKNSIVIKFQCDFISLKNDNQIK